MADDSNVEWPADPGPAGGFQGDPAAGATPPPAGTQGANGEPTPPPAGQPGAGADPSRQPGATDPPQNEPPPYRFEQLQGQLKALQTQANTTASENAQLKKVIAALATGQPLPGQPTGGPPDPRRERLRSTILELIPELKELSTLTKSHAERQADDDARQNRFAQNVIGKAIDHAAADLLGEGKTRADLSQFARVWLKDAFITWVTSDEARAARYDAGEVDGMANEFWKEFAGVFRATAVRQQQTTVLDRGQRRQNLPQQGSSAAPVGTPPPNLDFKDEAAVHKAAFAAATAGRR